MDGDRTHPQGRSSAHKENPSTSCSLLPSQCRSTICSLSKAIAKHQSQFAAKPTSKHHKTLTTTQINEAINFAAAATTGTFQRSQGEPKHQLQFVAKPMSKHQLQFAAKPASEYHQFQHSRTKPDQLLQFAAKPTSKHHKTLTKTQINAAINFAAAAPTGMFQRSNREPKHHLKFFQSDCRSPAAVCRQASIRAPSISALIKKTQVPVAVCYQT